ncbi:unnamed protein product [Lactuca virosa]|uniref:Cytochrome P450 n=1 Tax=Lactuca virosa TaxID=75947 RepID=A0AAU9MWU8_9ASTR|nr:unnamed protein product [Lactuca virosa]
MEVTGVCYVVGVVVTLAFYVLRFLNWVWFKPKKIEKFLRDQGLKGSSYKFLFGDLKEMVQLTTQATSKPIGLSEDIVPRVLPFVHKSVVTHGKICFTWMGNKPLVHVSEPSMIPEILANYNKFQKQKGGHPLIRLLGKGLFSTETHQWVKHRKIINPAFHVEKLKQMVPAFYISCSEMINKWEEMLIKESSCEVDVWPHLKTFASDVISRTAFGSSFEEGRKIFELQREQIELVLKAIQSIYIPGSRFLPTKSNKRIKETCQEVEALIRSIIDKRVATMESRKFGNNDLLGILLDSNHEEIKRHGQETTADLLVWTMILLSQHTKWQELARNEVLGVFGEKKPHIDGFSHLKTISMIFNEVLRLYPPAMVLGRMIHEEMKLGNMTLPAGTYIQVNTLLLHTDHDIWGEDAKEFKPERFSEGVSKATKGQTSYIPFGGGPRICIAQNFALMEAKTALVMILQRFSFELSPLYSHAPHSVITLQPQFGAHLILRKL